MIYHILLSITLVDNKKEEATHEEKKNLIKQKKKNDIIPILIHLV
jgi:hypothetical protein